MKTDKIKLRLATIEDAPALGVLHYSEWMRTYAGVIPQLFLASKSVERSTNDFLVNDCKNILVACIDDEIVGFCGFGEFRGGEAPVNSGEIQGIYINQNYQSMGIGTMLLESALDKLSENGFENVAFWVFDKNYAAVSFYERKGYVFLNKTKYIYPGAKGLLYGKKL